MRRPVYPRGDLQRHGEIHRLPRRQPYRKGQPGARDDHRRRRQRYVQRRRCADGHLSATVTSPNGLVNEGTETFTILAGSTPVGSPVTVPVVNGAAATPYSMPAGTRAGTYTIRAAYNGTANTIPPPTPPIS